MMATVYLQNGDGDGGGDGDGDGDDGDDGHGYGDGNRTWRGAKPSCRCPFLSLWLNHREPLMLSIIRMASMRTMMSTPQVMTDGSKEETLTTFPFHFLLVDAVND